jgi:hypothetical protein
MDDLLLEAGVERPHLRRVAEAVRAAQSATGCRELAVSNVEEAEDMLVKFSGLEAPGALGAESLLRAASAVGVEDAWVAFASKAGVGALEVHARVGKGPDPRRLRYEPPSRLGPVFLRKRLEEVGGGAAGPVLAERIALACEAVAREVVAYCRPELEVSVAPGPGGRSCELRFANFRECSASFVEHLFERCGRNLRSLAFEVAKGRPTIVARLDSEPSAAAPAKRLSSARSLPGAAPVPKRVRFG